VGRGMERGPLMARGPKRNAGWDGGEGVEGLV
jgi:hypothetical protein